MQHRNDSSDITKTLYPVMTSCKVLESQVATVSLLHLHGALPHKYPWLLSSASQVTYGAWRKANLVFASLGKKITSARICNDVTSKEEKRLFLFTHRKPEMPWAKKRRSTFSSFQMESTIPPPPPFPNTCRHFRLTLKLCGKHGIREKRTYEGKNCRRDNFSV